MAVTDTTPPEAASPVRSAAATTTGTEPGELEQLIGTGDHVAIGRLYIGFSLMLLVAGLIARLLVGIDALTDNGVLGSHLEMVERSSLVALVFLGVVPLLVGLAMCIVPLQVGSPAIAFPRAAALSLWSWLVSAGLFVASIALDGGIGGGDFDASVLGNISLGAMMVALALGSVCVATTVVTHRPPGMGLARVPLFSWSMLVASAMWIVTLGSAVAHSVIGHIAAEDASALSDNFATGLAWLLRAPAVYMLAIPVLGIAADVVAATTGRALRNYGVFQGLIGAFAVFSFGAWAQGPESINTVLWALWALAIGVPMLGLLGGLGASMRTSRVSLEAALVGSLLGLVSLLTAALVGLLMALDTAGSGTLFDFDPALLGLAQAVFVITAALAGTLAGIAHWSGQIWGAPAERVAVTSSVVMLVLGGGLLATTAAVQVFVRAGGNDADALFGGLEATGALLMGVGVLAALMAYLGAARVASERGAPEPPGGGLTLEWQVPWPAMGGERTAPVQAVTSPYPLLAAEDEEE